MKRNAYSLIINKKDLKVDLLKTLGNYPVIKDWTYMFHDGYGIEPHYHVYLNFGKTKIESCLVAFWFNVDESCIQKLKLKEKLTSFYFKRGNYQSKH